MRYLVTVSYDGTHYHGYQIQPNHVTIQSKIESALSRIHKGERVNIVASGRTDSGVHALGQAFHFDSELRLPTENWKLALNAHLPDDIVVQAVQSVDDHFHARYHVIEKGYEYRIYNHPDRDPFRRYYALYIKEPLDIKRMQEALNLLIGTHDFTAFCSSKSTVKGDKIRTIFSAEVVIEEPLVKVRINGSGFLYNMVRIIIGTLVDIGRHRKDPAIFQQALDTLDRSKLGKTASPSGLYLHHVNY
ncbi:tRNA pseudouridine(38-40) synthase [Streptohalobacillus salinus]|uniref:tRNA pseudouridine synthase A n=1 Tax=Streptohalobacillus salinus TaxID=621096 RepID=A0A2V3W048_9BACI|nr:tRNA pseudouridine(38-40) synthase TruA [Streptohalobacillus salinus]PXW87687.1 tRNA pseudouridine(38-40) synthase [Streptohalobacillus salinus]